VAEGWIVRRGRSTVFCRAEVQTESGALAATGELVYTVRPNGGNA
jgi:acyl-coenzyme A thioesterase PaaI-like protein